VRMRGFSPSDLLLLVVTLAGSMSASGEDRYVSYFGTATARHTTKILYGERHVLRYRDGILADRVVLYTCADGSTFARKIVSYVDPQVPDFGLEDAVNGTSQGIRSVGDSRSVYFVARRVDPEKSGPLPKAPDLVSDSGFDEFIRAHWQPLLNGDVLPFNFLVPSRLGSVPFQMQHLRSDTLEGIAVEVFHLRLTGVLGWVLPGFDVSYGAADHTLIRFEGTSDLRDASGDNFQTEINFRSSDRQPSTPAAMAEARLARLAPCP
jgi:hypothetical protein